MIKSLFLIILILLLVISNANASSSDEGSSVLEIKLFLESRINELSSVGPDKAFSVFLASNENFELINQIINKYGEVATVECFNGRSSPVFYLYICHTTYQNHKSGNGLVFYIFQDDDKYVGTRFGISAFYARKDKCLSDIEISNGMSAELSFNVVDC